MFRIDLILVAFAVLLGNGYAQDKTPVSSVSVQVMHGDTGLELEAVDYVSLIKTYSDDKPIHLRRSDGGRYRGRVPFGDHEVEVSGTGVALSKYSLAIWQPVFSTAISLSEGGSAMSGGAVIRGEVRGIGACSEGSKTWVRLIAAYGEALRASEMPFLYLQSVDRECRFEFAGVDGGSYFALAFRTIVDSTLGPGLASGRSQLLGTASVYVDALSEDAIEPGVYSAIIDVHQGTDPQ